MVWRVAPWSGSPAASSTTRSSTTSSSSAGPSSPRESADEAALGPRRRLSPSRLRLALLAAPPRLPPPGRSRPSPRTPRTGRRSKRSARSSAAITARVSSSSALCTLAARCPPSWARFSTAPCRLTSRPCRRAPLWWRPSARPRSQPTHRAPRPAGSRLTTSGASSARRSAWRTTRGDLPTRRRGPRTSTRTSMTTTLTMPSRCPAASA
mmetsp:Transcript_57338/g.166448  ORF Transcript_57338/g.166448 Transcript_57338/m.166448 type:complete len:209 (-) Transcript_57338:373-999(-)